VRDVARLPEFAWLGNSGALLVYAGDPWKPCHAPGCRFLACARTYNSASARESQTAGEWLPGLPPEASLAGGHASFLDVPGVNASRASVGVASLTGQPVSVRVRYGPVANGRGEVEEVVVPTFGHVRVSLKGQVGRVEVDVLAPPDGARLFPYVSVVDGESGRATHLLPDAVSLRGSVGLPPLPRVLLSELRRDI
jgi:hypothetical protein